MKAVQLKIFFSYSEFEDEIDKKKQSKREVIKKGVKLLFLITRLIMQSLLNKH